MRKIIWVAILLVGISGCSGAGLPVSGKRLFQENCANCHGVYADGSGPAAVDIGLPIPDLRYLTESNAGIFPEQLIFQIIDGQTDIEAHFSRRMPVWGYEFSLQEPDNGKADQRVRRKIQALTDYLRSIQQENK